MQSLPSRRFARFGIARGAGRGDIPDTGPAPVDTDVSASQSTVSAETPIVDDGVDAATVTVTVLNAAGSPLSGKTVVLAVSGTGNTITQPGAVTNGSGVATGSFVSTVAATKTISATADGIAITDTAATVVNTDATLDPEFFSDFSAATGSGSTARTDGGKWTISTSSVEVVASTGLGFPASMANVARIPWDAANIASNRVTGLSVPAVDTTRVYRWYQRVDIPDGTSDLAQHPVQDGNASSRCNWSWNTWNNQAAGTYQAAIYSAATEGYPEYRWYLTTNLDKATVYRIEVSVTVLSMDADGQGTFNLSCAVFDDTVSETVPVFTAADFEDAYFVDGGGTPATLATNPTFAFNTNVAVSGLRGGQELQGMNMGCQDNNVGEPGNYGYQGGFAVVDNQGSPGPYGSVTGEV